MGAVDKRIGELDPALAVEDDSKFPMEQQGEAMYMTGKQIKEFAKSSASVYVESAIEAASSAQKSAAEAAESLSLIGDSVTNAQNAQAGAETAAEEAKQYSGKPPKPEGGTWQIWNAATQAYEDSGVSSSLTINHSYPSVAAMEADFPNTKKNDLAIISSSVEQEDTAKLYINNGERWVYLADLSGVQGAPGVGISNIELTSGDHSPGTTDIYTITMTDGAKKQIPVYNGKDGETGDYIPNSDKGKPDGVATLDNSGKLSASQMPTPGDIQAVPESRKINNKALDTDITLSASDVGARPESWLPTTDDIGAVPTTRTVNGKPLSEDITLSAADTGALPSGGTAVAASKLETAQTIVLSGDVSGSATFDGTDDASITATLKPSGVTAGTYGASGQVPQLTTDAKGRVTSAQNIQILPSSIGAAPNPNLLLNSDFRHPVNRNGLAEYTVAGYTIDRWRTTTGVIVNNDSITIQKDISQKIENQENFIGKILTFSALGVDGTLYSGSNELNDISQNTAFYNKSGVQLLFNSYWKAFQFTSAVDLSLRAAKLELGSVQTLAHQENGVWVLNDPPNYDLQYALCSLYSPTAGEWVGYQHSNPNLLDNWYFVDPVNQRGQTEYMGLVYSIDRWRILNDTGTVRLTQDGLVLSATENSALAIAQYPDVLFPNDTQVTLSVLAKEGEIRLGYYGTGSTPHVILGSKFELVSYTYTIPAGTRPSSSDPFHSPTIESRTPNLTVAAAKLELGSQQTLAHRDASGNWVLNDPPPNKALELLKCQRYQLVIGGPNQSYSFVGLGVGRNSDVMTSISLPAAMRGTPTVVFGSSTNENAHVMLRKNGTIYLSSTSAGEILPSGHCVGVSFSVSDVTPGAVYEVFLVPEKWIILDNNL